MSSDSKKRLALAVIDFLNTSLKDGTVDAADAESIEVATNCIAESFHVDPTDQAATKEALGGQNLLAIYGVYEKLKGRGTTSAPSSSTTAGSSAKPETVIPKPGEPLKGATSEESERLKGQGNAAMQRKDYNGAVELYTKALEIAPLNPIYLSNRAAAYSNLGQHEFARNDAELATATDPKYTKAWSRLGLALFALGDAKGSMEAYKKGIDAEGNGGSDAMKKGYETAKKRFEEEGEGADADDEVESARSGPGAGAGGMPDLGSLASMFGGGGAGGGAGGGMPDLAGLMNNPMMRQMAQNLMSNPDMMNNLMNNPQLRDMASRFGGGGGGAGGAGGAGGGMPDMSSLMNDPNIAEMARNFMGGMGGAGRGRGQ